MKKLTQSEFIVNATSKHGSLYDYTKTRYITSRDFITITCNTCFKDFNIKANNHLNGQGCKYCAAARTASKLARTFEDFKKEASKVHNSKYSYVDTTLKNNKQKVIVICPKHGKFQQTVNHHLRGRGCPSCAIDITKEKNRNKQNVWSYSGWEAQGVSSKYFNGFTLYIIECWKDNERFIKIGKTFINISKRFQGQLPYDWKVIKTITGSARYISELEYALHSLNINYKYSPKIAFKGDSECFLLTENLHYEPKPN
jgi:ferredoxin-like protein FixX